MNLHEIFADPFDPRASIQLNNRYWPGEKFSLLSALADSEALLKERRPAAAANNLRHLQRYFPNERIFGRLLRRVHRLYSSQSTFGYVAGQLELSAEVVQANQYAGAESSAVYKMARPDGFRKLESDGAAIYRREYGADLLKVNRTVRFAMPNERTSDVTTYGELSDFHNDEYKGISSIVYLSDVQADNGAFSFIAGSELIPRSLVLTAIHQCVDIDMGLSGPDKLGAVPLEFRGSMAIGNYLDQDKVATFCRFRQVLEGGVGTYIIFNGQYLLHRGGKPISGTRTAGFLQPEGIFLLKAKGLASLLFAMTRKHTALG